MRARAALQICAALILDGALRLAAAPAPLATVAEWWPVVSAMRAIALKQDPAPMIVGERVNSQGSRRVKRLLLEDKYDDILTLARQQVEGGAQLTDGQLVALQDEEQPRADRVGKGRQAVKDRVLFHPYIRMKGYKGADTPVNGGRGSDRGARG